CSPTARVPATKRWGLRSSTFAIVASVVCCANSAVFCDVRRAFVSGWLVLAGCGDDDPDHDEDSTCFRIYGACLDPDAIVPPEVQGAVVMLAMSEEGQERSEEHTSELQSREKLVCRLLLEKKKL